MILLVNQHAIPLFVDVANAFAASDKDVRIFTGFVENARVPLSPSIRRIKSVRYNRSTTLTRFATWMTFAIHYFVYACFCKKPSKIVVVTNPPLAPFVTSIIGRWRNAPFYIVVFDLYPEVLQQTGKLRENGWLYQFFQRNTRKAFNRARGLITLSESMKHAIARYAPPTTVTVIPNWADNEYIKPVDKLSNPFVARYNLSGKLVVMYAGNMGFTHDLESLIEAAVILRSNKDIVFVLIGDGAKRKKLDDIRLQNDLNNVVLLPYQDGTVFPLAIAAADIGIVTLGTGGEGISVPSKTYINMAAGLAIIAISPANSELNSIVEKFSIGHTVLPGEPGKIAQHIRSLAANPEELRMFKMRSRSASLNFTPANAQQYVRTVLGD